jgi:hypothetical protein
VYRNPTALKGTHFLVSGCDRIKKATPQMQNWFVLAKKRVGLPYKRFLTFDRHYVPDAVV